MSSFENVVGSCKYLLNNCSDADYVKKYANTRASAEAQDIFDFGYYPSQENFSLLEDAVGSDFLEKNNLLYYKVQQGAAKYRVNFFEDYNLVMPYKDVYGNVIGLVGRTLIPEDTRKIAKYKNTKFSKGDHLFGLYQVKHNIIKNNSVFVVEGQFDCISAFSKGLKNVVALGSSNMTFDQFALIIRYTNNIILLLDNDDPGRMGAAKIKKSFEEYANIKIARLPAMYKDVDEWFKENTIDELNFVIK